MPFEFPPTSPEFVSSQTIFLNILKPIFIDFYKSEISFVELESRVLDIFGLEIGTNLLASRIDGHSLIETAWLHIINNAELTEEFTQALGVIVFFRMCSTFEEINKLPGDIEFIHLTQQNIVNLKTLGLLTDKDRFPKLKTITFPKVFSRQISNNVIERIKTENNINIIFASSINRNTDSNIKAKELFDKRSEFLSKLETDIRLNEESVIIYIPYYNWMLNRADKYPQLKYVLEYFKQEYMTIADFAELNGLTQDTFSRYISAIFGLFGQLDASDLNHPGYILKNKIEREMKNERKKMQKIQDQTLNPDIKDNPQES